MRLRQYWPLQLEMHAHDDLGLATANTLAAFRAGATHANTTVIGLGERAGNAHWKKWSWLKQCFNIEYSEPSFTSTLFAGGKAAGREIAPAKSLVGEYAFTHELVHVDGLLKDKTTIRVLIPPV